MSDRAEKQRRLILGRFRSAGKHGGPPNVSGCERSRGEIDASSVSLVHELRSPLATVLSAFVVRLPARTRGS
jgi:hypothetical protein